MEHVIFNFSSREMFIIQRAVDAKRYITRTYIYTNRKHDG